MTSILKADTIQDTDGNNIINENSNTITIGASGDTTNIIGTLQNNGSAISIASLSTASGSAPSYSARAWVNFNGTGTPAIRASGNVSSITDTATGTYRVNFTTAMSDANYCNVASVNYASGGSSIQVDRGNQTTTYMYLEVRNGAQDTDVDREHIHAVVFR